MIKPTLHKIASRNALVALFAVFSLNIAVFGELDRKKYIGFDEIRPDMEAYCLTVIRGTKIEKFPIKIITPMKGFRPGRDAILVTGVDEVFKKIGAVQGCSGSPVYIDGRMAGALSAGFKQAKDPLYIVTPIEEMLEISEGYPENGQADGGQSLGIDFSGPIDLAKSYEQAVASIKTFTAERPMSMVTSLPASVCESLNTSFGFNQINALSASSSSEFVVDDSKPAFEPGGVISMPLISGDITSSGIGTVTEVVGDTVYGFGHSFMGYGSVNFPIAGGSIYTVMASRDISFKMGQAGPIVGTLVHDQSAGIVGKIGQEPDLIPIRMTVNRFNVAGTKTYDCKLAYNRMYTPMLIQMAMSGAGRLAGPLPPDHTVAYKTTINVEGFEPLVFSNLSSGSKLNGVIPEAAGTVSMLMTNPYEKVKIESIEVEMDITGENTRTVFDSVKVSNTVFEAGDTVDIDVVLMGSQTQKMAYSASLKIPEDTASGEYSIYITGGAEYERLMRKLAPQKTTARSLDTLMTAFRNLSEYKNDKLYFVLQLKPSGVTIMQKELPYLPATKSILLNNKKRSTRVQPLNHWTEKTIDVGRVILGSEEIKIEVQE